MATKIASGGYLHTVPAVADDTFALIGATQTLTNKTLTSPVITGGTSTVQRPIAAQSTEGAITLGHKIVVLTHADAGAYTLAAPTVTTHDGMVMTFTAGTAAAHVITATDLLQDGVTGGAKDTATFAAYLGASLTLMAYQGTWYVISKNLVTIAAA